MGRSGIERAVAGWVEAVCSGREELFDGLLGEAIADRAGILGRARSVAQAFGERALSVEALLVDGDRVAWRWILRGTHQATIAGIAPTGRRIALTGANFQRVVGGCVVEHWTMSDLQALERQLTDPPGDRR
jgi:hypothetical protein